MNTKQWVADGLLLLTALIWGSGFVVVKNALDSFPPAAIIAMRYAIATLLTAILFRKHLRGITRADVLRGALLGVLLSSGYIIQTIGLQYTTAGKNAFLTTVYVLLVPFGCHFLFGQRIRGSTFVAAGLMLLGIGLLSLDDESGGLNIGDMLTLLCGVLFAAHIIAVDRCQKHTDTYALIVLQFGFCTLFALLFHLLFERHTLMRFDARSVGGLLYLAVFSTTIAMSLQNIAQSMAPASHAAILLSLESVFGATFSCLVLGEKISGRMLAGFVAIFAAQITNALSREKGDDQALD